MGISIWVDIFTLFTMFTALTTFNASPLVKPQFTLNSQSRSLLSLFSPLFTIFTVFTIFTTFIAFTVFVRFTNITRSPSFTGFTVSPHLPVSQLQTSEGPCSIQCGQISEVLARATCQPYPIPVLHSQGREI